MNAHSVQIRHLGREYVELYRNTVLLNDTMHEGNEAE